MKNKVNRNFNIFLVSVCLVIFLAAGCAKASDVESIKADDFQSKVLESKQIVLVDFWAPWCGHCVRMSPTIEEIAKKYEGRLCVFKLKIDEAGDIPSRYSIRGLPTLIIFKQGKVLEKIIGARSRDALDEIIDSHLK